MNDKISPEVNHQTDEHEDFDPLAELARIVAGESEHADNNPQASQNEIQEETLFATDDMEAELMRELQQTPLPDDGNSSSQTNEQNEDLSSQVDSINELDASLDNIVNDLTSKQDATITTPQEDMSGFIVPAAPLEPRVVAPEEPQEPPAAEAVEEPQEDVGDFQNDLIDALQLELDDSETAPEENNAAMEAVSEDNASIEVVEEAVADVEEVEEVSFEEEMAAIIDGSVEEPQSPADTAGIDKDEDLGKAFLSEFESRVGYTSGDDAQESDQELEVAELDISPPAASEVETVAEINSPELEMDFEQAFSEELGLTSTDEETQIDAIPTMASLEDNGQPHIEDEVNLDPGHSGDIPEAAPYQPEEKSGSVKYAVVAIIIALMVGAGVAVYGFVGDGKSLMLTETPVIEAVKSAYKTKPEDPGGKVVDNQDNATYAEVEGTGNQNAGQTDLVSNTEEPAVIDQSGQNSSKDDDRLANTEQGESAGAVQDAVVKPRVVQIQTVKPDGTIVASKPVSSAANKVEEQLKLASNQAKALATEVKTVSTQVIAPLKPLDGAKTTNEIVAPTASPKEKAAVETAKPVDVAVPQKRPAKPAVKQQVAKVVQEVVQPVVQPQVQPATNSQNQPTVLPSVQPAPKPVVAAPTAPSSPSSAWVVQVSSSPSQQEAQSSYNRMARRFPVIQGRSRNIQSAQVNGRTYYRLRLNTSSKSDASSLCSQLKASGGDCFVTR